MTPTLTKVGKCWGVSSCIYSGPCVEVHRIEGRARGICSEHQHRAKWNRFFVERGSLIVRQWLDTHTDETLLGPGECCDVAPGVFHQFEVVQDGTVCFEVYWQVFDPADIDRRKPGGMRSHAEPDVEQMAQPDDPTPELKHAGVPPRIQVHETLDAARAAGIVPLLGTKFHDHE